jgi:MarR family transcriptional regulator for hemolysin
MDAEVFMLPGHLINRSARAMTRRGEARFQQLGLAAAQLPVLAALKDGSAKTQRELAELAKIEQPTMAQLLARMKRDGLIRVKANPEDKRSSLVSLSARALKQLPAAKEAILETNSVALQGFSDEETATLCQLLRRVIENLDQAS